MGIFPAILTVAGTGLIAVWRGRPPETDEQPTTKVEKVEADKQPTTKIEVEAPKGSIIEVKVESPKDEKGEKVKVDEVGEKDEDREQ